MGYLTTEDIAAYIYCPLLYKNLGHSVTSKPLTLLEESIRKTFIEGERAATLKDSIVSPKKFSLYWDNIWLPIAAANNISIKTSRRMSIDAIVKFADYCRYDISDWEFPSIGVEIQSNTKINNHIITASADIIKADFSTKHKATTIVNFTNRSLDLRQSAFDPIIRSIAYLFYSGRGEQVTHVNVNISEALEKLEMTTSTFYPKHMDQIRKMLYHVEGGISNQAFYPRSYSCKECNRCQNIKL